MLKVWSDNFWTVSVDYRRKLVIVTRSTTPFVDADTIETSHFRLGREIASYALRCRALLLDSRPAPTIAPALEGAFIASATRIHRLFHTCAVLVRPSGVAHGKQVRSRLLSTCLVTSVPADAGAHIGVVDLATLLGG